MDIQKWLSENVQVITALAAIVNSVTVVVLVAATTYYAWTTSRILEESRKARKAAERQAETAQQNLELLKQQLEDQLGLGGGIVEAAIQTARSTIIYWMSQHLENPFASDPPEPKLLPANMESVLSHARRISPEGARFLASVYDDFVLVENEVRKLKDFRNRARLGGIARRIGRGVSHGNDYLRSANEKLNHAAAKFSRPDDGSS